MRPVDSRDVKPQPAVPPTSLSLCIPPTLVYLKWTESGLGAERGDHLAVWLIPQPGTAASGPSVGYLNQPSLLGFSGSPLFTIEEIIREPLKGCV